MQQNILYLLVLTIIISIYLLFRLFVKKKKLNKTIQLLVSCLEDINFLRDDDTGNHVLRVSEYSYLLAKKLNLSKFLCNNIKEYASLHDLGKVGILDNILKKKGKLTSEEFHKMKEHVEIGYRIIKKINLGEIAENIVRYHHEKYDGKGYLMCLKNEEIPIEARIVALADVYDALRQERCYKKGVSHIGVPSGKRGITTLRIFLTIDAPFIFNVFRPFFIQKFSQVI